VLSVVKLEKFLKRSSRRAALAQKRHAGAVSWRGQKEFNKVIKKPIHKTRKWRVSIFCP
jgi:hypothetical protein